MIGILSEAQKIPTFTWPRAAQRNTVFTLFNLLIMLCWSISTA